MDTSVELLTGGFVRCTPELWDSRVAEIDGFHRLYAVREGGASLQRRGETHRLDSGRIYLIPGGRPLLRRCDAEMAVDWLHFSLTLVDLDAAVGELGVTYAVPEAIAERWWTVMERVDAHFAKPTYASGFRLRAMLLEVLGESLGGMLDQAGRGVADPWRERLAPAVALMQERCEENPPLETVAREVHLSPSHFHRRFRETFGCTPHAWMERLRMRRALSLLREGRLNVSETAEAAGYANVYYFSRAFKRHFGVTPSDVRHGSGPVMP